MKVRAAVLERVGGPIRVQDLELEEPREGEVLVRMLAVGVCHSDWHLVTGDTAHPLPVVLGHEGAGVLVAVGGKDADALPLGAGKLSTGEFSRPTPSRTEREGEPEVGDLVSLNWAPSCGECFYCSLGKPALCAAYVEAIWAGTMLDGTTRFSRVREEDAPSLALPRTERGRESVYHYCGLGCFSSYVVVPAVSCVRMPAGLAPEVAAVIGCAVTTGVGSVLNTARVVAGSSVCVIGAGGVGLSTVMGAVYAGASLVVVVDPLESRREAAVRIGAAGAAPSRCSIVSIPSVDLAEVRRLCGGRGADYVFECVGSPALQELAVECARPGGVVVFSGLAPVGSSTNIPSARLVREEKTVMGSYYGTSVAARDFPLYASLFLSGDLPLDRLVSHRYSLDQINEAYADMLSGASVRGVVVF